MNPHFDPRLILPKMQDPYPPFVQFPAVLSPPECEALAQLAEYKGLQDGSIGNGDAGSGVVDHGYRKVQTVGLLPSDKVCHAPIAWLFERVRDKVIWANDNYYHLDLHGLWQQINYLQYDAAKTEGEVPGHYDWHQDYGGAESSQRKLSLVIQLADPEEYDGCRLELHTERAFDPGVIAQGSMIVFPSWCVHRVTPITRGQRRSLVSWVSGPPLR